MDGKEEVESCIVRSGRGERDVELRWLIWCWVIAGNVKESTGRSGKKQRTRQGKMRENRMK